MKRSLRSWASGWCMLSKRPGPNGSSTSPSSDAIRPTAFPLIEPLVANCYKRCLWGQCLRAYVLGELKAVGRTTAAARRTVKPVVTVARGEETAGVPERKAEGLTLDPGAASAPHRPTQNFLLRRPREGQ